MPILASQPAPRLPLDSVKNIGLPSQVPDIDPEDGSQLVYPRSDLDALFDDDVYFTLDVAIGIMILIELMIRFAVAKTYWVAVQDQPCKRIRCRLRSGKAHSCCGTGGAVLVNSLTIIVIIFLANFE